MDLPELAFQSIKNYLLQTGLNLKEEIPEEFLTTRAGTFVSIHLKDGSLRGCIGTIFPTKSNIAEEIMSNAVSAAVSDSRFNPIEPKELDNLVISVDILGEPEPVHDTGQLDPKNYGLILVADDGREGVLLPDIEGINTINEQIGVCLEKGNISPDEKVSAFRFIVRRYS